MSPRLPIPTRNVLLEDYQVLFIEKLIASGRYQNASDVLREGLRLLERRESDDELRLSALRNAAKMGIADMEAGNFHSFDSAEMLGQHLAVLTSEVIGA